MTEAEGKEDGFSEDEDIDTLEIEEQFLDGQPQSERKGVPLNIGLAAKLAEDRPEDGIAVRQDAPVQVIFDLPDGSQAEHSFKIGQSVEVLKGYVEVEFGIPMSEQGLYLGNTLMMDPMSLLDYPEIDPAHDVFITVEGELPPESRK